MAGFFYTLAAVLAVPALLGWVGGGTRPQLGYHVHHVGHDHLAWAHALEALGQWSVGVLLDVDVRLDGHRPPATCWVDGYLLEFRTERRRRRTNQKQNGGMF